MVSSWCKFVLEKEKKLKDNKIYNTALYCRLSLNDGSVGESGSIQTQKIILEEYAKMHWFKIYDVYVDDCYLGLNFNRPGFQRMIQDIQGGKINLVITKDLSRLGRDYIMTGYYTEVFFPSKKVRYIAINDAIDTLYDNNDIAPFNALCLFAALTFLDKSLAYISFNMFLNGAISLLLLMVSIPSLIAIYLTPTSLKKCSV